MPFSKEEKTLQKFRKIKDWRAVLSIEEANANYCFANTSEKLLLENIDWLIDELQQTQSSKEKILKSLGCM